MHARAAPGLTHSALAFVAVLHVAVVWSLMQTKRIYPPAPLVVLSASLLPPSPEIRPRAEIVPSRPKPVERRPTPLPQPIQLAAPAEAPAQIAVSPAPTFVAPPAPAVAAPVAAPTQPRFDADYLDNPKPAYPAISRRLGEQGRVVLRVHVDADGRAAEVILQTSSGSSRLDQSALDTVRRWKFVPAKFGTEPAAAWVLVPIAFTLKD